MQAECTHYIVYSTKLSDVAMGSSSSSFCRPDDTAELMKEAAQVALYTSDANSDDTQALLKTFAWVEAPGESTFCTVTSPPEYKQQCARSDQPVIKVIAST